MLTKPTDEIWTVLSYGTVGVGPCSVIESRKKPEGLDLWRKAR
jgi:hypothetical protein